MLDGTMILMEKNIMALSPQNKYKLEKTIRRLISEFAGVPYIGNIEVSYSDNIYTVRLLGSKEASPITLGFIGEEKPFLEYITKELKSRRLHLIPRTRTVQVEPPSVTLSPVIKV